MNQPASAFPHRVGQLFRALTARVLLDEEVEQAARILTPASLALFRSMAIQDQRHSFDIYTTLRQAGHTNSDLLTAALLHDVGKTAAQLPAWQRAIIVLLDHFAPRLLARLGRGGQQEHVPGVSTELDKVSPKSELEFLPKGWRRPFVVNAQHPEIGARWAQEAGCSPLTVALIQRHQDKLAGDPPLAGENKNENGNENGNGNEEDRLLVALQAADSLN